MVKNMMDRNREARRAAAMTNGLPRRRHRTTTGGSLRESPEDESPMELQEAAARLRDRTVKKERDREMRDRDRERERDRDRLNRSKRRRSDKYLHREDGGGGGGGEDETSEDSVNDEDEEDGQVRYVPPANPTVMTTSTSAASTLTSHRKSYPPPSKVIRVAPTWKAPDEMIGVSIPRKARSASTKRGHDCWSTAAGGVGSSGEQQQVNINRQASPSPVRSTTTPASTPPPPPTMTSAPPPSQGRPMSPSSSNVSIKKKIKAAANGPQKQQQQQQQRPPKSSKSPSPSSVQEEIEIEVAEVLYGLMRQSHAPSKQDAATATPNDSSHKLDSRSIHHDSKSRFSSSSPNHSNTHNNNPSTSSSSTPPLTTVAPKRKRPRPHPEENNPSNLGHRSSPKLETYQPPKLEPPCPSSEKKAAPIENGGNLVNSQEPQAEAAAAGNNGMISDTKQGLAEESSSTGIRNGMLRAKVEEASPSSPKLESPQNLDRVESSTTSTKLNSGLVVEQENHREDKLEIDLMAPPPQSRASPEREEEMAEFVGRDDKCMVTEREAGGKPNTKPKLEDEKSVKCGGSGNVSGSTAEIKTTEAEPPKCVPLSTVSQAELKLSGKERDRNIDLHLDLDKTNVNADKLNFQKPQPPPQTAPPFKATKDESNSDTKPGGQSGSGPLPMSVPGGWHGGLQPMGYVGPLQGVVSMDGTPMASPPIQPPTSPILFTQPRPKRCATHCYVARSILGHQQMMKMHPFWPAAAAAAGPTPLFGSKPYNLNMMPSAEVQGAGRGVVVNSSQDNKAQPFAFIPGQPASSKDKSPQTTSNATDSAQKKQFLLQPGLPPGAPSNLMHGPALFFPMGQQQPAVANARPTSTKSPSTTGAPSVSAATSAPPMSAVASNGGPAMSFSYPHMGGNEAQFMAILGNGGYPFPIPAHVGAAPPYRGSHPQAMSFFNGSFYSSQMLHHPSQLQQQQPVQQQQSQSMQIPQQNQPNVSISTASSSSQKQLQNLQQQRPHGNSGNLNQGLQNFQANKGRACQPQHEVGGEDSPSTADSRNRPNMSVYGQNFAMSPFHSANFAMITPPSSMGTNVAGVPNGNHGDKKQQQQQQQQTPSFPMSFATINGATTPGLDISSIAHNHAMIQSLPEAARQNYQLMATAAAQVAQQKKNSNYRGSEDGKTGVAAPIDASNIDEERKALTARAAAASVGQSIAFSRDLSDNSMPGNSVVDTSARSLNLIHGSSTRSTRASAQNSMSNSNVSSNSQQQQQQQQQQQMLFTKQQQYVGPAAGSSRSKTPTTTNGNVYPDHLTSSSIMAAKFPNSLSGFPLVQQTSGASVQSTPWKNSVRPNTTQISSPTMATSNASNIKNLPQQGRSQQNHTQISFGTTAANIKSSSTSQGQQAQNNNQAPASPMVVGSPSTSSVSKGASGSPRTNANASTGNKAGSQASSLPSQQGKNSQSPSLSSQKPSLLGSPHHIMSNSNSANRPQMQQPQQQPQFSKQAIPQTQMFTQQTFMQAKSAIASGSYYLPRQRPDNQQQQQQQQHGSTSQGMGHTSSSSGMLTLCTPVTLANSSTSDPAKAVAAAAAANSMKGGLPSQGIFHATQFAAQSAGGAHQLMPAGYPYVHAVSTAVQAKPTEQKQPAGE